MYRIEDFERSRQPVDDSAGRARSHFRSLRHQLDLKHDSPFARLTYKVDQVTFIEMCKGLFKYYVTLGGEVLFQFQGKSVLKTDLRSNCY